MCHFGKVNYLQNHQTSHLLAFCLWASPSFYFSFDKKAVLILPVTWGGESSLFFTRTIVQAINGSEALLLGRVLRHNIVICQTDYSDSVHNEKDFLFSANNVKDPMWCSSHEPIFCGMSKKNGHPLLVDIMIQEGPCTESGSFQENIKGYDGMVVGHFLCFWMY